MKTKFLFISCLLLFSRGCDFYSTSLWFFQENGMASETNPLTQYFGVGWNGLIIANVILVGLILAAYYYYSFHYKPNKEQFDVSPKNFKEYISLRYYGVSHKFYQVFYKIPKSKKIAIAHFGYVSIRVLIIASFLATTHNLCQFYNVEFYNTFRELIKRPLYFIYGVVLLSGIWVSVSLFRMEFRGYQIEQN